MSADPRDRALVRNLLRWGLPYAVVLGVAGWATEGPLFGAFVASMSLGTSLVGYGLLSRTSRRITAMPAAIAGVVLGFVMLLALR